MIPIVVTDLKKPQSGKCKDNLNFSVHYGAAEKNEALLEGKQKLKFLPDCDIGY